MKQKNEIGSLIRKGLSKKEIQKQIKDFPDNPDVQYFQGLGYSQKTAYTYKYLLNKNSSSSRSNEYNELLMSKNANKNNIILDTCALKHKISVDLLTNSKSVTILYATLKEFDAVQKKVNVSSSFKCQLRKQTKELLLSDSSKYHLVPYEWKSSAYTDELILEYIFTLPVSERPTILTADQNLALRAKCLGIDYILHIEPKQERDLTSTSVSVSNETPQKPSTSQGGNLGVEIIYGDSISIRKHNPSARIFLVKNGVCKNISSKILVDLDESDYFGVIAKSEKHKVVKLNKISLENNQKKVEAFKCYCENDIKQLKNEFHSTILDCVRKVL